MRQLSGFGSFAFRGDDADASSASIKLYYAIRQREERIISADADIAARVKPGAALAHNDVAGANGLTAVDLDA